MNITTQNNNNNNNKYMNAILEKLHKTETVLQSET
jgi:hypothetical protein